MEIASSKPIEFFYDRNYPIKSGINSSKIKDSVREKKKKRTKMSKTNEI